MRCLGCFTGVEELGRPRSAMPLELYRSVLDQIGDYLLEIEFYNWGEPLLAKHTFTMVEEAHRRGIGTFISTNFSVPFDADKAERLVASGLSELGVSVDGASQETYEQYRVRGDFEKVIAHCRLVNEAKKKLRSKTPRMVYEFHVFEHNAQEIEAARALAEELEMGLAVAKGWIAGPAWEPPPEIAAQLPADQTSRFPCMDLWNRVVINNDGGVAPCCGAFYKEDDFGTVRVTADAVGRSRFKDVWNNDRYQEARRLFRSRDAEGPGNSLICYDCPVTVQWERFKAHVAAGGDGPSFEGGYSFNDGFNYFFDRRQKFGKDAIALEPLTNKAATN